MKVNLCKTLYVNFKVFPIRIAYKLPIYIYGKIVFRSLKGQIIIEDKIKRGMIKVGKQVYVATSVPRTIWIINGTLIFKGQINFEQGTYLLVSNNANLTFGTNGTFVGSDTKIMCFENIFIGDNVEITWECQIIDTSFHYIFNEKGETSKLTKKIIISDNIWIGNRTTIMKGAILPEYSIVASNSLINKDFSDNEKYSFFAGQPAKLKASGFKRNFNKLIEKELDKNYNYYRTHL